MVQTGLPRVTPLAKTCDCHQPGLAPAGLSAAPGTGRPRQGQVHGTAQRSSRWQRLRPALGFLLCAVILAGCTSLTAASKNAEGVRLLQQARYQEALAEFQQAARIDPQNADAYYNLAATYHRLGKLENRPNYLEQAELLYQQCLDRDPGHVDCHRGLAVLLCEQGRAQEAIRLLQGWVDRQPRSADARIELARLYDELGDKNSAVENLLACLAMDADNPRALTALGKLREEAGQHAQALENYARSLARDNRQPAVAARIASLQSAVGGSSGIYGTSPGTRLVDRQTVPWR